MMNDSANRSNYSLILGVRTPALHAAAVLLHLHAIGWIDGEIQRPRCDEAITAENGAIETWVHDSGCRDSSDLTVTSLESCLGFGSSSPKNGGIFQVSEIVKYSNYTQMMALTFQRRHSFPSALGQDFGIRDGLHIKETPRSPRGIVITLDPS